MAFDDEMIKEAIELHEKYAREWGELAILTLHGTTRDRDMLFIARKQAEMYRNKAKIIAEGG